MYSHYFEAIEGIAAYPAVSLSIFLCLFAAVLVMTARMKKDHVQKMSNLPLE